MNAAAEAAEHRVIAAALKSAGMSLQIRSINGMSGGCISRVVGVTLADGMLLAAKIAQQEQLDVLIEESSGLQALAATHTVIVPHVLAVVADSGLAAMLMTFIKPPRDMHSGESHWQAFGSDLAAMHLAPLAPELNRGYGFVIDNHLGSTHQPNTWLGDWIAFNVQRRLGHQLKLAVDRQVIDARQSRSVEQVIGRVPSILPRSPRASLLHGDLWSGNVLPAARCGSDAARTCAVIDPAPYVGDALADIAMMKLFGGFPRVCFEAWAGSTSIDTQSEDSQRAISVYQLYHVLNHVNIFGHGYMAQALSLTAAILRA